MLEEYCSNYAWLKWHFHPIPHTPITIDKTFVVFSFWKEITIIIQINISLSKVVKNYQHQKVNYKMHSVRVLGINFLKKAGFYQLCTLQLELLAKLAYTTRCFYKLKNTLILLKCWVFFQILNYAQNYAVIIRSTLISQTSKVWGRRDFWVSMSLAVVQLPAEDDAVTY